MLRRGVLALLLLGATLGVVLDAAAQSGEAPPPAPPPDRRLPSAPLDLRAQTLETGLRVAWAQPADPGAPRFVLYHLYVALEGEPLAERGQIVAGALGVDLALDPGAYAIALSAANELGEGPRASTLGLVLAPPAPPPEPVPVAPEPAAPPVPEPPAPAPEAISPAPAPAPAPEPAAGAPFVPPPLAEAAAAIPSPDRPSRTLSTPEEAAGAMATGIAIAVAAALAPRLFDLLGFVRDAVTERVADEFQDRTAQVGARRFRLPGWIALLASLAALAILFALPDADRTLAGVVEAIPVVGVASLVFVAGAFGAEWLLAAAGGERLRFKLWAMGTVSLVITSLVFRQPFGATGYLDEGQAQGQGQGGDDARGDGIGALGTLGGVVAMALPFMLLGWLVHAELGEVGVEMALAYFAIATLPVKPFPGRELWRWSRPAWGAVAAASLPIYYLYEVGSLPEAVVLAAGVLGGLLLAWAGWIAARPGAEGVSQPRNVH